MSKNFYDENSADLVARINDLTDHQDETFNFLIIGSGMIGREHMRVATLLGGARVHGIYDTCEESMDFAEAEFKKYSEEELV